MIYFDIYARCSRQESVDKGLSLASQIEQCTLYGTTKGWTLHKIYSEEEGLSGSSDNRTAFQQMVSAAQSPAKIATRIICLDTSRFSRSREHAIIYKKLLKKHGVDVLFVNLPRTDSVVDGLIESILESFDEFHSNISKEKGFAALSRNAALGFSCGGRPPYGYAYEKAKVGNTVKKRLVIHPETAEVVRRIFDLRIAGTTTSAIAHHLHSEGIAPPQGASWNRQTIIRILRNHTLYSGTRYWNKTSQPLKKQQSIRCRKQPEQWIAQAVPAILPPSAIAWANSTITPPTPRRKANPVFLLAGLVLCGACKRPFETSVSRGNRSYRCSTRSNCHNQSISAPRLEQWVIRCIESDFKTDQAIAHAQKSLETSTREIKQKAQKSIEAGSKELQSIEMKLERLATAIANGMDFAAARKKQVQLLTRQQKIGLEIAEAENTISRCSKYSEIQYVIQEKFRHLSKLIADNPPEKVKNLLTTALHSIILYPNRKDGYRTITLRYSLKSLVEKPVSRYSMSLKHKDLTRDYSEPAASPRGNNTYPLHLPYKNLSTHRLRMVRV